MSDSANVVAPADGGNEGIYNVEKILDAKKMGGQMKYLVRWEGYSPADDTWEPKANLESCWGMVETFLKERKAAQSTEKSASKSVVKRKTTKSHFVATNEFYEELRKEEIEDAATLKRKSTAGETSDDASKFKIPKTVEKATTKSSKASKPTATGTPTPNKKVKSPFPVATPHPITGKSTISKTPKSILKKTSKYSAVFGDKEKESTGLQKDGKRDAAIFGESSGSTSTTQQTSKPKSALIGGSASSAKLPESKNQSSTSALKDTSFTDSTTSPIVDNIIDAVVHGGNELSDRLKLYNAVVDSDATEVSSLLEKNGPYRMQSSQLSSVGYSLIMHCAKREDNAARDNCRIIEALALNGALIDFKNLDNETALILIAKKGSHCCLETLLKFVPRLNIVESNQESALFAAVRRKKRDMIASLLYRGADYNQKNSDGFTVVDIVDEQVRNDPDSVGLKATQLMLSTFAQNIQAAFDTFTSASCNGTIRLTTPLFDLQYISSLAERGTVEIRFNAMQHQNMRAVLLICTALLEPEGMVRSFSSRQPTIVDKVVFNGREPTDCTRNSTKASFCLTDLFEIGNHVMIETKRDLNLREVMLVGGFLYTVIPIGNAIPNGEIVQDGGAIQNGM